MGKTTGIAFGVLSACYSRWMEKTLFGIQQPTPEEERLYAADPVTPKRSWARGSRRAPLASYPPRVNKLYDCRLPKKSDFLQLYEKN